ncbi:putative HTH-type transcriptional regulator YbdO [Sinobacterium norvegicum]|uniref:HTH-type transcriptional regulator YbdO n=1 Tax=Sinobacterium norvegicum TaxID=1641715 RepID=A0ABM9ACE7_9GAMM|nr:LysR family transcriptional regulator [Sinobacterium norvegicum]CAH0990878.1 putative HTH-type transcriptional regulator YbdO [Sinobacterium norvegicum]
MINLNRLTRADLNLLISLQLLMEERSVSRAAERSFITQSAMSRTLQRLRDMFEDPLFARSSHGLEPTPRAVELYQQMQPVLSDLSSLLQPAEFDPAELDSRIIISCPSLLSYHWIPQLIQKLTPLAPKLRLRIIDAIENPDDALANGEADLVLHAKEAANKELISVPFKNAAGVCLVRQDHPMVNTGLSFEDFLSTPHVRYFIPGITRDNKGLIDKVLSDLGKQRHIAFEGNDIETLLDITRSTDYLFVIPTFQGNVKSKWSGITSLALPEELGSNQIPLSIFYHRSRVSDPAIQWLLQQMSDI